MQLSLFVPGLAWPDPHTAAEVARGLELPALSTLLGRGALDLTPATFSELTAIAFGLRAIAPARRAAEAAGLAVSGRSWLLAEPGHLRIDRDRATLADVGILAIDRAEADALVAALNAHFAEDGLVFHAAEPGRWFVSMPEASGATFTPLDDVVGEDVNAHLPGGDAGLKWSRFLNELQMLLYTHPVNDAREERGEPAVNTVWLWGEGDEGEPSSRAGLVLADHPLWQDYARRAGVRVDAAPFDYAALAEAAGGADRVLVMVDAAQAAAQYRDVYGWREALEALEERWFAPLLAALRARRLGALNLVCHGDAGFTATVTPLSTWKAWRRPRALATLFPSD
ncbi:hypothetical protein [Crenobacter luteus]|uniref:Phosphoglycerate mutase n=1 Tax=Crenobacter luteus TaxID=1452487 RepID=A0A165G4Q8_9NEIS|nr:hypothetical protein [Crenobacter luteus]KZE35104.1 hypothetical protein AVW16_04790 [Crenobacter luteus]